MTPQGQTDTNLVAAITGIVFITAPLLAWLLSAVILGRYRARVVRGMRTAGASVATAETPGSHEEERTGRPSLVFGDTASRAPSAAAEELCRRAWRAPWQSARIYGIAGACAAALLTAAWVTPSGSEHPLIAVLYVWPVLLWPVALTSTFTAARDARERLIVLVGYLVLVTSLGAVAVARNPALTAAQFVVLWSIVNVPPTLAILALLNRRVRTVGPLVFVLMSAGVVGTQATFYAASKSPWLSHALVQLAMLLHIGGGSAFFVALGLGFILFMVTSHLMLRALGKLYEKKLISDESVIVAAVWLLPAVHGAGLLTFDGAVASLAALGAFPVFVLASTFLFSRASVAKRRVPPVRLLLLRVFSLGHRSEWLFQHLTKIWRYVGSVQLIAGPDLASATIEPHEFLDYIGGRLDRRFIDSDAALEQRLAEMDVQPDADGRYRVNDFFCRENAWRATLQKLMADTDVTVMDLRGFSVKQAGCIYEIEVAVASVPLQRIVIIIDDTTDQVLLHEVAQRAWRTASDHSSLRGEPTAELKLFRMKNRDHAELRRLVLAIAVGATQPSRDEIQLPHQPPGRTVLA